MNKFKFGQTAKDKITGFTGVVIARTEFLTGCTQYALQPPLFEGGKFESAHWFDETRLTLEADVPIVTLEAATAGEPEKPGADIAPPRA